MSDKRQGIGYKIPQEKQLGLPFDQYQRHRAVADVIEKLREDSRPLRVLDIGGEGPILDFLPEDLVTILDPPRIKGMADVAKEDATTLPFEDESYDYVLSVDVYDHIEPTARDRYLSELRRVSQRGVLLAGPFDSGAVRGAERVVNEFHRSIHPTDNVWSKERAENGLPQVDDTKRFFEERDDKVFVLPLGYIPHWLAMTCLTFYSSKLEGELRAVFDHANAFYNEFLYELDNVEPCYRYLLVSLKEPMSVDLGELTSPKPNPERAALGSAMFGTLSAVLPLGAELERLNVRLAERERSLAEKEGALARREAQVSDLSHKLAESTIRIGLMREQLNGIQWRRQIDRLQWQIDRLRWRLRLEEVTESRTWRVVTSLRKLMRLGPLRIRGND
jgi:O-antigen biosynthesis protein